jgi:hypothetical protein
MTYGAYALSDSGSGVLWGDFTDTYYHRGYFKWTGFYFEHNFPRYLLPNASFLTNGQFINSSQEGESSYFWGTWTVWIPKFNDNDLIFLEPKDAACFAASIEAFPPGSYPSNYYLNWYSWWKITISVLVPKVDLNYGDTGNPYLSYANIAGTYNRLPAIQVFTTYKDGDYYTSGYGLGVYRADGTTAFNSALDPLQIKDIIDVSMPQDPAPYQYDMNSVNTVNTAHASCSRPMYHFPSLAQAVQEYAIEGSSTVSRFFGLTSTTTTWSFVFWVIYGGGFHKGDATNLTAKWCHQGAGFFGTSQSTGSAFFGLIPTGSSSNGSGTPPFRYNSVNYTGIPVLVADASNYPSS